MTEQIQARRDADVVLPSGEVLANIGLAPAAPHRDRRRRDQQVAGVRTGIDLGLTVIDTSRWPVGDDAHSGPDAGAGHRGATGGGPGTGGPGTADPAAEELVAEAIRGRRDDVFLIGRAPDSPAARQRSIRDTILAACQESLRRLDTDRIDLYLLPPPGTTPLQESVEAVNLLMTQGLVRHWGVTDFDIPDLVELTAVSGGTAVEADQVGYDLAHRAVEQDLLTRCRAARLPILARVSTPPTAAGVAPPSPLASVARRHDASPAQIGLAWVLRQEAVYAVVEATAPDQVRRHRQALDLVLTEADLTELDQAFPGPRHR